MKDEPLETASQNPSLGIVLGPFGNRLRGRVSLEGMGLKRGIAVCASAGAGRE